MENVELERPLTFEEVRSLLPQYLKNPISKIMRNKLAGYLVRTIKKNF